MKISFTACNCSELTLNTNFIRSRTHFPGRWSGIVRSREILSLRQALQPYFSLRYLASLSSAGDSVAGRPPLPRPPKPSIRPRDLDRPGRGKNKITCQDPLVGLSHSPLSEALCGLQPIARLHITAPAAHEHAVCSQRLSKQVKPLSRVHIMTSAGTDSHRAPSLCRYIPLTEMCGPVPGLPTLTEVSSSCVKTPLETLLMIEVKTKKKKAANC